MADLRIEVLFATYEWDIDFLFSTYIEDNTSNTAPVWRWFRDNAPNVNVGNVYDEWCKRRKRWIYSYG